MQSEFEKRIQQQMEEFALTPGEAVWPKVEARIQEKKRRRVILYWWTAGLILVAVVTGIWLAMTPALHSAKAGSELSKNTMNPVQPATQPPNNDTLGQLANTGEALQQRDSVSHLQSSGLHKEGLHKEGLHEGEKEEVTPGNMSSRKNRDDKTNDKVERTVVLKGKTSAALPATEGSRSVGSKEVPSTDLQLKHHQTNKELSTQQKETLVSSLQGNTGAPETTPLGHNAITQTPQEDSVNTIDTSILSTAPLGNTAKAEAPVRQDSILLPGATTLVKSAAAKRKMQFGITIYTGLSNNKTGFPLLSANENADVSYAVPGSSTGGTGNAIPDLNTRLNYGASISYGIGVFIRQPLSRKVGLTAGIDYHYFSARTQAGTKLTTARNLYDSVLNTPRVVNEYYTAAISNNSSDNYSTFTNKYHLIQLLVNLEWQINNARHKPILLSLGLTPGFILSTSALYYDRYSRISYVEKEQFRSFQMSAQGGIMFTLSTRKKYGVELGPQFMYSLSNLAKAVTQTDQHLFFFGVKSNIMFLKKTR